MTLLGPTNPCPKCCRPDRACIPPWALTPHLWIGVVVVMRPTKPYPKLPQQYATSENYIILRIKERVSSVAQLAFVNSTLADLAPTCLQSRFITSSVSRFGYCSVNVRVRGSCVRLSVNRCSFGNIMFTSTNWASTIPASANRSCDNVALTKLAATNLSLASAELKWQSQQHNVWQIRLWLISL